MCARLYDLSQTALAKLHSTNPIGRLNGETKRRTEVVAIFPNDDAIVRLVGALQLEQNDEWPVRRSRYMTPEIIAQGAMIRLSACQQQADTHPPPWGEAWSSKLHHSLEHDRDSLLTRSKRRNSTLKAACSRWPRKPSLPGKSPTYGRSTLPIALVRSWQKSSSTKLAK